MIFVLGVVLLAPARFGVILALAEAGNWQGKARAPRRHPPRVVLVQFLRAGIIRGYSADDMLPQARESMR